MTSFDPAPVLPAVDSVRLVDSIPWRIELGLDASGVLHRVEVHSTTRVDTLPGMLTAQVPLLVGDSLVIGVRSDSLGEILGVFHYRAKLGRIERVPLPIDLKRGITDFRISPDGRHIAYVRFDEPGPAVGIVRVWPTESIVAITPGIAVPEGDVMRGAARWQNSETFEIFIDPFNDGSNRWVRFRGRLGNAGFAIDTAVALPLIGVPP